MPRRLLAGLPLLLLTLGCGSAQKADRGPTFCRSYEGQYLLACQQRCEAGLTPGDEAGIADCRVRCGESLRTDDEFAGSCGAGSATAD